MKYLLQTSIFLFTTLMKAKVEVYCPKTVTGEYLVMIQGHCERGSEGLNYNTQPSTPLVFLGPPLSHDNYRQLSQPCCCSFSFVLATPVDDVRV